MADVSKKRVHGTQGTVRIMDVNDIWTPSSTQQFALGSKLEVGGRVYRYCYATEALSVCNICSCEEDADALSAATIPATTAGDVQLDITLASQTRGEHTNRILAVYDVTGQGYSYRIRTNDATSGTTCTLYLNEPIQVATATDSVGVIHNDAYVVQICNTGNPVAEVPICVAPDAVTTEYYFWGQTRGYAQVLADTSGITAGQAVHPSEATSGAGQVLAGTQEHTRPVGFALTTATSTNYAVVFLTMD
jgi:hypothetical protein